MTSHLGSRPARLRRLAAFGVSTFVAVAVATSAQQLEPGPRTRTLYASAVDAAGQPVLDLSAADIQVKADGVLRPFEMERATEPLRVVLLVSQSHRHDRLLESARALCNALDGAGQISVISVIGDAETSSGFSDRSGDCLAALNRIELKQDFGSHMNPALVEGILGHSVASGRERSCPNARQPLTEPKG